MAPINLPQDGPEILDEAKESGNEATDDRIAQKAAESLRADDIASVRKVSGPHSRHELEHLSIDELRSLANTLDVKDRSQITEKEELIDEILKAN